MNYMRYSPRSFFIFFLVFLMGGVFIFLIIMRLRTDRRAVINVSTNRSNQSSTNNTNTFSDVADAIMLAEGETQHVSALNIDVTLTSLDFFSCLNTNVGQGGSGVTRDTPDPSCAQQRVSAVFTIRLPGGDEGFHERTLVISTLPGAQTADDIIVQFVEFRDTKARILLRRLGNGVTSPFGNNNSAPINQAP